MHCGPSGQNRQRFSIYVLELGGGRYYVGSTAKSVAERVREHEQSGRRVLSYKRVGSFCMTRERAELLEARTARRLRARGFDVEQA